MYSPQEIAVRITESARQHKISVNKLLLENGLGKSVIDNMKAGKMPSADRLAIIARALGTDSYYLLGMGTPESLCISGDITSSNVVQGTNQGTLIVRNGNERSISDEEVELLRIYNKLDIRTRHQLMAAAFEFEKKNLFNEGDLSMNNRITELGKYVKTLRGDTDPKTFVGKIGTSLTPLHFSPKDSTQSLESYFVETMEGANAVSEIPINEDILKRFFEQVRVEFNNQNTQKGYTEIAALAEESGWDFAAYNDLEVKRIYEQLDKISINSLPDEVVRNKTSMWFHIMNMRELRKGTQANRAYRPTARTILKLAEETKKQPEYFTGIGGDISNKISGNISNSSVVQGMNFGPVETTNGEQPQKK
ncbi:MAG: hypothetical protein LBK23_04605 [Oscillospiraceae bacterium]|jgi:transcriptional regulator with XRE-family HTH domain|nr:hypothetical protein [Oscillospiraceae bacterium]